MSVSRFRSKTLRAEIAAETPLSLSFAYAGLIDLAIAVNAETAKEHRRMSREAQKDSKRSREADTWKKSAEGLDDARAMLEAERIRLGGKARPPNGKKRSATPQK
jgi:hypothetical protein